VSSERVRVADTRTDDVRPTTAGPVDPATPHVHRGDVEGLRAVAVLAVVAFHVGLPGITGGYVGVDVFFVLSGFLITGLLLAEVRRTGSVSLPGFWGRRARRILPLATLVSLVTLAVAWLTTSPLALRQTATDAVWGALFATNIQQARQGVDYLAGSEPSPFQHYWSLAVEEQFYLLWPLVVLGLALLAGALGRRRRAGSSGIGGTHRVPLALFGTVTAVLVVASFTAGVRQTVESQPLAYFWPWTRGWELGVGALLAVGAPLAARCPRALREVLAVGGLGAVGLAVLVLDDGTPFPGTAALLPVLGTAAVVLAGTGGSSWLGGALASAPLRVVGRLSYGWYLWHWPVLVLGPGLIGDTGVLGRVLLALLALGLAALSYALLEDPLRRQPSLVASAGRSLVVGGLCVLLAAGAGLVAAQLVPTARSTGPDQVPALSLSGTGAQEQVTRAVATGEDLLVVPANLDPTLEDAATDVARARNDDGVSCMVAVEHSGITREPGGSCVFGEHPDGETTVVLIGDSHAYQWYPALNRIADERGWRLVVMTKAGCPLYDVELVNSTLRRDYTECYDWREAALDRVEAEDPDLVVTTAAVFSAREGDFTERWNAGVARSVEQLRARSAGSVVLLEDTPNPGRDVPRCVAENLDDVQQCATPLELALTDVERREGTKAAAAGAGATVVETVPWFCGDSCPAVIGNTLAYHDEDHITATYAEVLSPLLAQQLQAALAPASPG